MPPKRIPKPLKKAILGSLFSSTMNDSLPSAAVADRVNNNPQVPARMMKTPKQMAYLLNQMIREYPGIIETQFLNRNGMSRHGVRRFRKGYLPIKGVTLAEAEQAVGVTRKKQNQAKNPDSE